MTREEGSEEPFDAGEMFFSRTDPHGRIVSGNRVFQRVSGYDWPTLSGAPHKIIRHPDTPRAVFHLLWREIGAGRPVGAYVKNRSRQGGFYWVFAIVTPTQDGFLSVRIKPCAEVFIRARALYDTLQRRERDERLDPAASATLLETTLRELGFPTYQAFMSQALVAELKARDLQLGRPRETRSTRLDDLARAASGLLTEVRAIDAAYALCRYMPLNLRIQAVQLGQRGAAVETVSSNYALIVAELARCLDTFTQAATRVETAVLDALFLLSTARIQSEILQIFAHEHDRTEADVTALSQQSALYDDKALASVRAVARQTEDFQHACAEMKRLSAGLEVTRIIGKVESARLAETSDAMLGMLNELGAFQRQIADGLTRLDARRREIFDSAAWILQPYSAAPYSAATGARSASTSLAGGAP